jgi:hypothetical protein
METKCMVCGVVIPEGEDVMLCAKCNAPVHIDCHSELMKCPRMGCGCKDFRQGSFSKVVMKYVGNSLPISSDSSLQDPDLQAFLQLADDYCNMQASVTKLPEVERKVKEYEWRKNHGDVPQNSSSILVETKKVVEHYDTKIMESVRDAAAEKIAQDVLKKALMIDAGVALFLAIFPNPLTFIVFLLGLGIVVSAFIKPDPKVDDTYLTKIVKDAVNNLENFAPEDSTAIAVLRQDRATGIRMQLEEWNKLKKYTD